MSEDPKNLGSEELLVRNTYLNVAQTQKSKKTKKQNGKKDKKGKNNLKKVQFNESLNSIIQANALIPNSKYKRTIFISSFKGSKKVFSTNKQKQQTDQNKALRRNLTQTFIQDLLKQREKTRKHLLQANQQKSNPRLCISLNNQPRKYRQPQKNKKSSQSKNTVQNTISSQVKQYKITKKSYKKLNNYFLRNQRNSTNKENKKKDHVKQFQNSITSQINKQRSMSSSFTQIPSFRIKNQKNFQQQYYVNHKRDYSLQTKKEKNKNKLNYNKKPSKNYSLTLQNMQQLEKDTSNNFSDMFSQLNNNSPELLLKNSNKGLNSSYLYQLFQESLSYLASKQLREAIQRKNQLEKRKKSKQNHSYKPPKDYSQLIEPNSYKQKKKSKSQKNQFMNRPGSVSPSLLKRKKQYPFKNKKQRNDFKTQIADNTAGLNYRNLGNKNRFESDYKRQRDNIAGILKQNISNIHQNLFHLKDKLNKSKIHDTSNLSLKKQSNNLANQYGMKRMINMRNNTRDQEIRKQSNKHNIPIRATQKIFARIKQNNNDRSHTLNLSNSIKSKKTYSKNYQNYGAPRSQTPNQQKKQNQLHIKQQTQKRKRFRSNSPGYAQQNVLSKSLFENDKSNKPKWKF